MVNYGFFRVTLTLFWLLQANCQFLMITLYMYILNKTLFFIRNYS